jgi:hypothetical protein
MRTVLLVGAGLAAIAAVVLLIATHASSPGSQTEPARSPDGPPSCAAGCRAASRCGVGSPTCVADCENNPSILPCLAQARTDCNAAAMCTFGLVCSADAPHGSGSCADALRCQMQCDPDGDGLDCGCKCAATLAPERALLLMRVDACATACKFDNACMLRSCKLAADACAMR